MQVARWRGKIFREIIPGAALHKRNPRVDSTARERGRAFAPGAITTDRDDRGGAVIERAGDEGCLVARALGGPNIGDAYSAKCRADGGEDSRPSTAAGRGIGDNDRVVHLSRVRRGVRYARAKLRNTYGRMPPFRK